MEGKSKDAAPGAKWRSAAAPPDRCELLNRTFYSEQAQAASPLPRASPIWASRQQPPTPLDAAREEQYRNQAVRLLSGEPPSPLRAACGGIGPGTSPAREGADTERETDRGHANRGHDATGSGGGEAGGSATRKRVGYRQPTTSRALHANPEEHIPIKRMSAENKVVAYENRLQDQQTLMKTLRKNEERAREAEAEAVAGLEGLRKEMHEALCMKDSDLETLRMEYEALRMAHDSLKATLKTSKAEAKARQTDELTSLHEQLKSTSKIISALSAKVEQQREHVAELESRCQQAEGEAQKLKEELSHWQEQHQDVQVQSDSQLSQNRKQLNLARDQMALNLARNTALERAWTEKQEQLEEELVASGRKNKEIKALVQARDKELANLKEEMLKKLWRPDVESKGIQTDEVPNRWLWLLTLKIAVMSQRDLQHEKECQTDTVRIEGMPSGKARVATMSTQTAVDTKDEKATEEDLWWNEMVARVNSFFGYLESSNGAQSMPEGQILALISAIYAEKSIADYQDVKNKRVPQPLQEFVWGYLLRDTGDKTKAEKLVVRFLANILWRTSFHKKSAACRNNPMVAEKFLKFRHRYCLFLRFLGFSVIDNDAQERAPITSHGLDVFLQMLVRIRRGACPLLEASSRQIMVPMAAYFDAIDFVFSSSKSFERERIKTEVADFFHRAGGDDDYSQDEMDLEVGLEFALKEYDEIAKRWDTRLEAVFASNDKDGDGNLDFGEFQGMMRKLSENASNSADDTVSQIRMYANMCMWPRVDSNIFIKVAKKYRVCFFTPGQGYQAPKEEFMDTERLCQRLVPLHKAASESMLETLDGIQLHPHGQDLLQKWTLCEKLMIARQDPMMAWVIFHQATRLFSTIQAQLREIALQMSKDDDDGAEGAGLTLAEKQKRMLTQQAFASSDSLLVSASVGGPVLTKKKAFSATTGSKAMTRLIKESNNPLITKSSGNVFAAVDSASTTVSAAPLTPAEKRSGMLGAVSKNAFCATMPVLPRGGLTKSALAHASQDASTCATVATSTNEKEPFKDGPTSASAPGTADARGRNSAQTDGATRANKSHSPTNRGQPQAGGARASGRSVSPPRVGTGVSARAARQKNPKLSSTWVPGAAAGEGTEGGGAEGAAEISAGRGRRGEGSEDKMFGDQIIDGRPKSPSRPLSPVRAPARRQALATVSRTSSVVSRTPSGAADEESPRSVHFAPVSVGDAGTSPRSSSPLERRSSRLTRTPSDKPQSSFDVLPSVGV